MARFATLTIGTLLVLLWSYGVAQESTRTIALNSIIEAMEKTQAGIWPRVSYQVVREYQLFGANGSNPKSSVVAEVEFRPPSSRITGFKSLPAATVASKLSGRFCNMKWNPHPRSINREPLSIETITTLPTTGKRS